MIAQLLYWHSHPPFRMWLRAISFTVAAAAATSAWSAAEHDLNCGHKGITVEVMEPADLALACDALADVLTYFRSLGFDFEPRFSLTFADGKHTESANGVVAYGYADLRSSVILVRTSSYRQPWGLPWNRAMVGSFLRHELAHIAVWQILGPDARRLRHEWHEFVAYAIQLHLMDGALVSTLLANFSDARAFDDLTEVNEFVYGMNPDRFAVMAYLTYREKGAQDFVRGLLRGEIIPPAPSFPFPVLPHEGGPGR